MDPLFWLYADNYRTYNVEVAEKLGSIFAAILLAELASRYRYHRERDELVNDEKHGSDWFYYMYEDVERRTCLSRKNQDTAIRILESHGLIEKKAFGMHPKRHFRLNFEGIEKFCNRSVSTQFAANLSETDKMKKQPSQECVEQNCKDEENSKNVSFCPKRTNRNVRFGHFHIYNKPKEEPKNTNTPPYPPVGGDAAEAAARCASKEPSPPDKIGFGSEGVVMLTPQQHEMLLSHMSAEERSRLIEDVTLEICQRGKSAFDKKSKSHYHTILSWKRYRDKKDADHVSRYTSKIAHHRRNSKLVTPGDYEEESFERERI